MNLNADIDVAILGGGISGLALSVLLAKNDVSVVLFEKGEYPKHKVCGEYVSNESLPILQSFGLNIDELKLPKISKFKVTDKFGNSGECDLQPGGFGFSRYAFDDWLSQVARDAGVKIFTSARVRSFEAGLGGNVEYNGGQIHARVVFNATGRSAKMAKDCKPWVGVKYHIESGPPANQIEIHSFEDGYCGTSKIEQDKYCLCYLVKAKQLKKHTTIEALERNVLCQNKRLAARIAEKRLVGPITTSQFYFGLNTTSDNFNIGDAAGFIPPLTGNGMSLALRSASLASASILPYLTEGAPVDTYHTAMKNYKRGYLTQRIWKGIALQNLLNAKPDIVNNGLMKFVGASPFALRQLTKLAVGKPIY